ncbi:MAG: outer membrane protein transport protein [Fimbriimonadaceae bacterium]|nr:outer membrane protein transport protein [Fimbriimonadaceae bacterium]
MTHGSILRHAISTAIPHQAVQRHVSGRLKWLGCLALWALLTPTADAGGLIRDGIGAISMGRVGTNIAHSDNGAVILDNPAGLVNFEGRNYVEFGIDTVIPMLHYTDQFNNTNNSTQPLPIPEFAWYHTSEDRSWAVGFGVFAPAGYTASYMLENPVFGPGLHRYRSMGAYAKILPGIAFHITEDLSIGASFGLGVTRIQLDGPFFLQTGPLAGTPANFDMSVTGAAPIWNIGVQYQLTDDTTIGLAYNSDANFAAKGNLDAVVLPGTPLQFPSTFNSRLAITWPQSLGLGIKHTIADQHRLSCDVVWYGWSSAFDDLGLTQTAPTNPIVPMLLGSSTIHDNLPLNWADEVSMRFGYEYFATDNDTWRFGYAYHPSPVPSNTLNPYLDGILEHAGSIGYSHRWDGWLLNLAYQYDWGPTRAVKESIIAGRNFANSTLKAQAHWIAISVSHNF